MAGGKGLGVRVWGLGFRLLGLGIRVWGLGWGEGHRADSWGLVRYHIIAFTHQR